MVTQDRWAHLPEPPVEPAETWWSTWRRVWAASAQGTMAVPEQGHGLSRAVWTQRDFATMGWHDASIWAYEVQDAIPPDGQSAQPGARRVVFDIDYTTRWVTPKRREDPFTFWVAPCTLVFTGVSELEIDLSAAATPPYDVEGIYAVEGGWHLLGHDLGFDDDEGPGIDVRIAATGFTQTFRQPPVHMESQVHDLAARGGYSYSEVPASL